MGAVGVVLVRRAVGDHAAHDDQRRPVGCLAEGLQRGAESGQVVDVIDLHHVPAITGEALPHIFAECQRGVAFDGDGVVVIDPAEVREFEVPGDGSRLGADAFHQIAVAAQDIHLIVEQVEAGTVVPSRQPALGDRHADAVADALPERTGRRLHAARVAVLGVSGAAAIQLAEAADVVQRHRQLVGRAAVGVNLFHFAQVQHGIEQHRGMPAGEHEAVAVGP